MEGDQLYGLPLERFVPERDALAKALRAEGRREDAAKVGKLRKPSVAAWAVNQLVRTQGQAWQDLLAAGDGLADAHAAVISGAGDGASLRTAVERERAAVDDLMAAARGLLSEEGHDLSPATIERVADTLHAAALDADARAQVADGRLERELRHVGLGSFALGAVAPVPATRAEPTWPTKPANSAKPVKPAKKTKEDRERAAKREAERKAARKAARATEADARRRLERAERALKAAREARDRAAAELAEAGHNLAAAQAEAEQAAEVHRTAAERLDHVM